VPIGIFKLLDFLSFSIFQKDSPMVVSNGAFRPIEAAGF
jgi:hypothetical protein